MKLKIKILIIIWLIFSIFFINWYAQWTTNFESLVGNEIKKVSWDFSEIKSKWWNNIVEHVKLTATSILKILKSILVWVLLIYIIYIWITMIISMWTDEDKLTKSKNQLWYSLIAIFFINMPYTIYNAINSRNESNIWNVNWTFDTQNTTNIFVNWTIFNDLISNNIVAFIEVAIFWIAIFTIVMHWIKIMSARWREEEITKAKDKILYSLFAILFVWFIDSWRRLAISWDISEWWYIFWKFTDLALLFAGPVVIFFLTLAWYYYITSNWDEERVKKSKSIIVNTFIGIILIWAMFTFLNDLSSF